MPLPSFDEPLARAAQVVADARYVTAFVGAGMSVESGIAPFRGKGGLWTKYGEPPMNGYQTFLQDPRAWWVDRLTEQPRPEARGFESAQPNPGHHALVDLERMGILNYVLTQNVDNLHRAAGSVNVAEIHGNRTLLRCIACGRRFPRDRFTLAPETVPPHCPACNGLVKGDGVMFGEPIPRDVLRVFQEQSAQTDCMLLLGTSAVVYPAAGFPGQAKLREATLIEINSEGSQLTPICDLAIPAPTGAALPLLVRHIRKYLEVG